MDPGTLSAPTLNETCRLIHKEMSYTPPRGPCSQKNSMLSTCACFRFMVHPLKAATSFDCDGCGHHASFHKMENHQDEEAVERWKKLEAAVDSSNCVGSQLTIADTVRETAPKRQRLVDSLDSLKMAINGRAVEGEVTLTAARKKRNLTHRVDSC